MRPACARCWSGSASGIPIDLYEGEYEGLYCVGCEEFKAEGVSSSMDAARSIRRATSSDEASATPSSG
jgi:hypothetical protein